MLNAPNLITLGRFFLIPIFIFFFFADMPHANLYAFMVILVAGISDMVDGYLARKHGLITDAGKLLDPLADKLMMLTVILAFVVDQRITWLAASFFFIRDLGMIISSAFFHFQGKKTVPAANFFGKATTFLFYVAFLMVMFTLPYYSQVLWAVIIFSFITSIIYIFSFRKINRTEKELPSPDN